MQQMVALEADIQEHIQEAHELNTLMIRHLNNAKELSGLAATLKDDGFTLHSFQNTLQRQLYRRKRW